MRKSMIALLMAGATTMTGVAALDAAVSQIPGSMGPNGIPGSAYDEMTADWDLPYVVPAGIRQLKVSDETDLDIYDGQADIGDMNTVNEDNSDKEGCYLYRTHEVDNGGSISVVDLCGNRGTRVIAQATDGDFMAPGALPFGPSGRDLDGIEWTPWNTLLFAEEDPNGHIYEMTVNPGDKMEATSVTALPHIGLTCHEGLAVRPNGELYFINEQNGGSIYKFVPDTWGDLSSGTTYALKVLGADPLYPGSDWTVNPRTGDFEWVEIDTTPVADGGCYDSGIQPAATAAGATEYGRPEDTELIGKTLYVALTSEDRVISVDLARMEVETYVAAGVNVPFEDRGAGVTGLNSPDNIAAGPNGELWIVEDNYASDIWVARPDHNGDGLAETVGLFASLKDPGAETTGIYFGTDSKTVFVNIQHADKPQADGTWVLTKRQGGNKPGLWGSRG